MRIVVIFDSFGPYHLARLHAAGRRVQVTAVEIAERSAEYAWSKLEGTTNFVHRTLFACATSGNASGALVKRDLWLALELARPDVVAVPGWSDRAARAALAWCTRNGIPAVMMSESTEFDAPRRWLRELVKRRIVSLTSAGLVGGCRSAEYLSMLGMANERIFIGYDVVDNDHFAFGAEAVRSNAGATRAQLGLPEKFFLACSRFVPKKNLFRLIDAFAQYRVGRGTNAWGLVLAGDGELKLALLRHAHQLGVADAMVFAGFVDYENLPAYYGLAGAFVHPSTVEQWGLVVNEAMAAGLPVLVSERCGCATELVEEGINGFTFDPDNAEKLARLMGKVSDNSDISGMGKASARIISGWTPALFAENLVRAAVSAIAAAPPRRKLIDCLVLRALVSR